MNGTKNTYIYLVISLVCICFVNTKCRKNEMVFSQQLELEAKVITIPSVNNPKYVRIIDSCLIVTEKNMENGFIKVFQKNNLTFLSSAGRFGKGPGEIVNPARSFVDEENRILWCPDWGKHKIWLFPLDSILQKSNYLPNYSVPIPTKLMPIRGLNIYNHKIFAFINFSPFISFLNHTGEEIDSLGIRNPFRIDFWDKLSLSEMSYSFIFKPDRTKIFIASQFENFIGGIDINGEILFTSEGSKVKEIISGTHRDKIKTYGQLQADDKYIYCLYSGKGKGILQQQGKKKQYTIRYPDKIRVFNWNGTPIAEIQLEFPLFFMAVDKELHRIYGMAPEVSPSLVYYELPDFEK